MPNLFRRKFCSPWPAAALTLAGRRRWTYGVAIREGFFYHIDLKDIFYRHAGGTQRHVCGLMAREKFSRTSNAHPFRTKRAPSDLFHTILELSKIAAQRNSTIAVHVLGQRIQPGEVQAHTLASSPKARESLRTRD